MSNICDCRKKELINSLLLEIKSDEKELINEFKRQDELNLISYFIILNDDIHGKCKNMCDSNYKYVINRVIFLNNINYE